MKLHHLCLSLLLLPAAMFAENLSGTYSVHGYDPSSVPPQYQGLITIQSVEATAIAPDVRPDHYYDILWTYSDFQSISGRGVRKDDYLAIEFVGVEDPSYAGVQLYKIEDDKHCHHDHDHDSYLKGPWVLRQGTTIGQERLTKINFN